MVPRNGQTLTLHPAVRGGHLIGIQAARVGGFSQCELERVRRVKGRSGTPLRSVSSLAFGNP